jgi:hypothetical protein
MGPCGGCFCGTHIELNHQTSALFPAEFTGPRICNGCSSRGYELLRRQIVQNLAFIRTTATGMNLLEQTGYVVIQTNGARQ